MQPTNAHCIREPSRWKNIGGQKLINTLYFRDFADKHEGSPEVWVRIFCPEFLHGGMWRARHILGLYEVLVELLHEHGGAAVVNVPEGEQESGCTCTELQSFGVPSLMELQESLMQIEEP
jgi:hypothetical protein